jgi:hypothetical protein
VQSATVYKPASKWTIVAAFIVAVVLFASAVVWVEMQQEKPAVQVSGPVPIHSVEKVTFEPGAESNTAAAAERSTGAD